MQVTLKPNITTFKGSFKQVDLNELLPESDNWQKTKPKPIQTTIVPDKISRKAMMKVLGYTQDDKRTDIALWEAQKDEINAKIPQSIKNLCKFHGIDPTQDLFMVSGTNKEGQLFVVFNSFFRHEEIFEIPKKDKPQEKEQIKRFVDCEQVYCLKSDSKEPTPLQMDIVKIFNDSRVKNYLLDGSTKNPLKTICNPGVKANDILIPAIHGLSCISKEKPLDELMDEKGRINKVIYSADGEYTRYRIIYLPIK